MRKSAKLKYNYKYKYISIKIKTSKPTTTMSALRTETIPTTIGYLVDNFAGRISSPEYDDTKIIRIHRRNRAFVWIMKMVSDLFDSIIKGYYIQPIVSCSLIENGENGFIDRRYIMDGGNRTTAFYLILNNAIKILSEHERIKVRSHPISLVVMYNLTGKGQRELFTRLNKCVKATAGQLYAMSEEDSPLVQEVKLFIGDSKYPLRK